MEDFGPKKGGGRDNEVGVSTRHYGINLVFCQVKKERSYAYSTKLVSLSGRRRLTISRFCEFLFLRYRRYRVFLWLATADMASL